MKILIVEDMDDRNKWFKDTFKDHELDMVNNSKEAIELVKNNKYDFIFLDHDLGNRIFVHSNDENTGYQVAIEIPKTENKQTPVVLHSWNPGGVKNMEIALKDNKNVYVSFFGSFDKNILQEIKNK